MYFFHDPSWSIIFWVMSSTAFKDLRQHFMFPLYQAKSGHATHLRGKNRTWKQTKKHQNKNLSFRSVSLQCIQLQYHTSAGHNRLVCIPSKAFHRRQTPPSVSVVNNARSATAQNLQFHSSGAFSLSWRSRRSLRHIGTWYSHKSLAFNVTEAYAYLSDEMISTKHFTTGSSERKQEGRVVTHSPSKWCWARRKHQTQPLHFRPRAR